MGAITRPKKEETKESPGFVLFPTSKLSHHISIDPGRLSGVSICVCVSLELIDSGEEDEKEKPRDWNL